jgi:hypothetical protein
MGVITLGIQQWGLVAAGVGFWIAYLIYYAVVSVAAYRLIGFKLARRIWWVTLLILLAGGLIMYSSAQSTVVGYGTGLMATLVASVYSLHSLDGLMDLRGWLLRRFG